MEATDHDQSLHPQSDMDCTTTEEIVPMKDMSTQAVMEVKEVGVQTENHVSVQTNFYTGLPS